MIAKGRKKGFDKGRNRNVDNLLPARTRSQAKLNQKRLFILL